MIDEKEKEDNGPGFAAEDPRTRLLPRSLLEALQIMKKKL